MYVPARIELLFFVSAMKYDKKNLCKRFFSPSLSLSIILYLLLNYTMYDRKGCFIIMSDLRLTIEDMIACIWFRCWCHSCVASFELVERTKYTNAHTYKSGKNMHSFFCINSSWVFFPIRILFMAQSLKFISDQNKHRSRESFSSFQKYFVVF